MIFGLFKKEQSADSVFINGNIYTQNPDMPWAEAVACQGGEIIYVGNSQEVENLTGQDTNVIDMEGKYLLPGFMNTHSHPAMRIFQDTYIPIADGLDLEDILGMMSDYIVENPEVGVYFAYGFASHILKEHTQEEASKLLDDVCADKPILLVSTDESVLWVNNCALEIARTAAQEEGVLTITLPYFLHVVAPFEEEELQNRVMEVVAEYCEKGFTTIFNAGAPEFMDNIYQDILMTMYQQDMLKQRNFGSFWLARNAQPQIAIKKLMEKKTVSTEMDDYVRCNTLKLLLTRESTEFDIFSEKLEDLFMAAAERGFDVHIDTLDKTAFQETVTSISQVRNNGYRKNNFIVACDEELRKGDEAFNLEELSLDNVFFQPATNYEPTNEYAALEGAGSVEEIIDRLTIDAAIALGVNEKLGSIEKGKQADFVMFEENPFQVIAPALFKKHSAVMTVVAGQIVYDVEEDNMQEWYNMLTGMQV